ncbi:HNH endonuclease signature motif containing protein [Actinotalea solisilvae]|uniref:HNH endonuclease signature motif containing protein n=1 Tax=Actinotalea solisilvae TaxID=2072922 RepID=UPI0018F2712C|nr:HNH endonuclease signature motif containing protein [Actinotalea solisilvae]
MALLDALPAPTPSEAPARQPGAPFASGSATATLERAVAHLSALADGAARLTASERAALLRSVDQAIGTLSAARGRVLVAERRAGTWRGHGDPTFEAWRARTSRSGVRPVLAQLRQADAADHLPRLGEAAHDGVVTPDHLDAVGRVVAGAAPPVRAALATPEAQAELLAVARRVDAGTFGRAAARIAARLDPRGLERSHQAQRAARYLHVTDGADGTRVNGLLDRMAGHRLRLALEAVTPRPAADDERTSEQRRADALEVLAGAVLADPGTQSGAAVRPHVSFHLSDRTWAGIRADRARRTAASATGTAEGTRTEHGDVSLEPVTLDDGTPVPMSEVARALCDCALTRIVMDSDGVPLDLGRTARTYTGAQRRAVVARDRGCGWPGCDGQARWSEVHHMRWWDRDGGVTSVENGVLLCTFHHHEVHRRDLTIAREGPPDHDRRVSYRFTDPGGRVVAEARGGEDVTMGPSGRQEPEGVAPPARTATGSAEALVSAGPGTVTPWT